MILNSSGVKIESSGVESTANFAIEGNQAMFDILTSRIYDKPIHAVIRELSTNAVDAHIASNKADVPIHVTLPGEDECLYIRDFGNGLSHEDILNIYTKIGKSTKSNSNEYNGCFGIGSKSPFAYTDSFNVNAYDGKTKRIYVMAKDEEQLTANLIGTFECDEPAGLEIQIPVKASDAMAFHRAAKEIYPLFEVMPVFVNLINSEACKQINTEQFQADGYCFHHGHISTTRSIFVVMGNVAYPVEFNTGDNPYAVDLSYSLTRGYGNVYLYAPIGSIVINPGRERLSYKKNTNAKEFIESAMEKVYASCLEKMKAIYNSTSYPNLFAKTNALGSYWNDSETIAGVSAGILKHYPNEPVLKHVDYEFTIRTRFLKIITFNKQKYASISYCKEFHDTKFNKSFEKRIRTSSVTPSTKSVFVSYTATEDNEENLANTEYLTKRLLYVFRDTITSYMYNFFFVRKEDCDALVKELQFSDPSTYDVLDFDELIEFKHPRQPRSANKPVLSGNISGRYYIRGHYNNSHGYFGYQYDFDLAKTTNKIYYAVVDRSKVLVTDDAFPYVVKNREQTLRILDACSEFLNTVVVNQPVTVSSIEILTISKTEQKKLNNNPNFINVVDLFIEQGAFNSEEYRELRKKQKTYAEYLGNLVLPTSKSGISLSRLKFIENANITPELTKLSRQVTKKYVKYSAIVAEVEKSLHGYTNNHEKLKWLVERLEIKDEELNTENPYLENNVKMWEKFKNKLSSAVNKDSGKLKNRINYYFFKIGQSSYPDSQSIYKDMFKLYNETKTKEKEKVSVSNRSC